MIPMGATSMMQVGNACSLQDSLGNHASQWLVAGCCCRRLLLFQPAGCQVVPCCKKAPGCRSACGKAPRWWSSASKLKQWSSVHGRSYTLDEKQLGSFASAVAGAARAKAVCTRPGGFQQVNHRCLPASAQQHTCRD